MKIITDRDLFLGGVGTVLGAVESRNAMPVLSNVLLTAEGDVLYIRATDLEVTIKTAYAVGVVEEGSVTLNGGKLHEVLREIPSGDVSLAVDGDSRAYIQAEDGGRFELMGLHPDDFPPYHGVGGEIGHEVPCSVLAGMIKRTIYAASGEDGRFNTNGIYVERDDVAGCLRMVATNGHRLAIDEHYDDIRVAFPSDGGIILPRKGAKEAAKFLGGADTAAFTFNERQAEFTVNNTTVSMVLLKGQFPDYQRIIPDDPDKRAVLDVESATRHLRRVSTMADEKSRAIALTFSNNNLEMASRNPNFGSSTTNMEIEYTGDPLAITLNDRYLLDFLSVVGTGSLSVYMVDENHPIMIRHDGQSNPNYKYILMPMRA